MSYQKVTFLFVTYHMYGIVHCTEPPTTWVVTCICEPTIDKNRHMMIPETKSLEQECNLSHPVPI